jgi:hypothetical protein
MGTREYKTGPNWQAILRMAASGSTLKGWKELHEFQQNMEMFWKRGY